MQTDLSTSVIVQDEWSFCDRTEFARHRSFVKGYRVSVDLEIRMDEQA